MALLNNNLKITNCELIQREISISLTAGVFMIRHMISTVNFSRPEATLLNTFSSFNVDFGVAKFIMSFAMNLVTLCNILFEKLIICLHLHSKAFLSVFYLLF